MLLALIIGYFLVLLGIAYYTSRNASNDDFFVGGRSSHWLLVAFGMIGTSLSGVTFVSIPGTIAAKHFTYFMVVLGYFIGYLVVAYVLLPLYYRMQLTSIYKYLEERFGEITYKTGAAFFIVSRTMGATLRLYLVINVLQLFVMEPLGINFYVSTIVILGMILMYTFKGGVKSIVWTDTLQTTFMLLGLVVCLFYCMSELNFSLPQLVGALQTKGYTEMAVMDYNAKNFIFKHIIGGIFITITMTGLDQEMMQKNISVKTLGGAQKNMLVFSVILLGVNLLFLLLGGALYLYAEKLGGANQVFMENGKEVTKFMIGTVNATGDNLFPTIALKFLPPFIGIIFVIGLISALFPSADGAITALTSSFCIDILGINNQEKNLTEAEKSKTRQIVHLSFAFVFLLCIIYFKYLNNKSIIDILLDVATYTYGPLLGLFLYGIFTKRKVFDALTPIVCIAAPAFCYYLNNYIAPKFLGDYKIGLENLLINGLFTVVGLYAVSFFAKEK